MAKAMGGAVISSSYNDRRRTPRWPANDRRRTPRQLVLQMRSILAERGGTPHYCLVIDRSDGGVRLRTTSDFALPDKFVLRFANTETTYNVVWRNGAVAGAAIVN